MRTLKQIAEELDRAERELWAKQRSLFKESREVIKVAWPKYDSHKHVVGFTGWAWDCPDSPFGYCAYDEDEDPCRDDCLFCGHPEERK